mgnify:CR=1 FL=1
MAGLFGNCYGGAWGWSYASVDANGSWSDVADALGQFNAAHAADLAIPDAPPLVDQATLTNKLHLPLIR